MPNVSVIIPTYNCARFLPEAIDSALAQTYQDFELIIINDGSTDHTKEIVDQYLQKYSDKIRYFYQENAGLAAARNTGMRAANGQLIAILDSDDKWFPQRLEEGLKAMAADENIGLVHSHSMHINERGVALGIVKRSIKYLSGHIFTHLFLRRADVSCPTVLFRKECCDQLGLFDESLTRLGCEDRELWIRIAQQYKIAFIDKPLAYYRVRSASMSRNLFKMLEARLYVINKYCPSNGPRKRLRNLALAKIYKDVGDEFLYQEAFNQARKSYAAAIAFNPFYFWAIINFLKAFLEIKVHHVS